MTTNDEDYIPPTPVYNLEKIQWHSIGWASTVGRIVNDDLDKLEAAIGGGGGTGNYETLTNKPKINGVTLSGDKTGADIGVQYVLTAGQGITLDDDTQTISVAVDGTTVQFNSANKLESHTSYANISGNPSDNTALNTVLATKANISSGSVPLSIGKDSVGFYIEA